MKMQPQAQTAEEKKPQVYRCDTGNLGCRCNFLEEQFSIGANLCRGCLQKIGTQYGVDPHDAGAVATALQHHRWYVGRYAEAAEFSTRKRVRILLLASNVPILQPTEHEAKWADYLRQQFPHLGGFEKTKAMLGVAA